MIDGVFINKDGGVMMKRLVMILVVCLGVFLFASVSVAATLKDYKPKNEDEAAVVGILQNYQESINSYEWKNFLPLFAEDAI